MAVTAVATRAHFTQTMTASEEFGTVALSGTYVQGGFTLPVFSVKASAPGSTPLIGTIVEWAQFYGLSGYQYVPQNMPTGGVGAATPLMTIKIMNGTTELAAGALPDATINFRMVKTKGR